MFKRKLVVLLLMAVAIIGLFAAAAAEEEDLLTMISNKLGAPPNRCSPACSNGTFHNTSSSRVGEGLELSRGAMDFH
jgi:hypothetical protein